ncbi:MAG: VCBS repeat-containing protein [Spirochaetaceae bacterium]|nr:VCBS repeat-containing protein [Spirochaetaceae bacterium]
MLTGGAGALLWYDPETGENGYIDDKVNGGVGLTIEDVDGDGVGEIFLADDGSGAEPGCQAIAMYKLDGDGWKKYLVDTTLPGSAHDIVFGDVDGDGIREIVTIACYSSYPGVFILKPTDFDGKLPVRWTRHTVSEGVFTEGVSIGDLNGDGKMEIVSGPDWYEQPAGGPYGGPWKRHTYATTYREMCRTSLADITGNGRPDIVITDSEYMDGTLSWYENRLDTDGPNWIEHQLNDRVVYSHSLEVRERAGGVDIFIAEMEQGGWKAPYNHDARLLLYSTEDGGTTWKERELYKGEGTHEATIKYGENGITVYGKTLGRYWLNARIQVWREPKVLSHLSFNHVMIDRDKAEPGTDILAFDPFGNGKKAIACGKWVYLPDNWERIEIPGVSQIINACDIDGDGRDELIATTLGEPDSNGKISPFNNDICRLKLKEGSQYEWETHIVATGHGDWPHGSLVAPVLPGDKQALMLTYHSANGGADDYPQIIPIPESMETERWNIDVLAQVRYGEEMAAADITGDGTLDIVAGNYWLRNNGDGTFTPHTIVEDFMAARVAVGDIAGNGRPDVMLVEEKVDYTENIASFARMAWFECPADPENEPWKMHMVDSLRSPHSLSAGDIDGDGVTEFIAAEHDPFWPYRKRNRLFVYKSIDGGTTWYRRTIDSRFEHHDGGKLADLGNGKQVIMSHGWKDSIYVHLWEISVDQRLR